MLYRPLPGETLSQLLRENDLSWMTLQPELARFINHLHASGVYFPLCIWAISSAPQAQLGLIDIADLQIRRRR